jgi:DNA-dependent RNA polymerase auxiliary subunit epsilon
MVSFLKTKKYHIEYVSENLNGKPINYKHINKSIKDDCKYLDILFKLEE